MSFGTQKNGNNNLKAFAFKILIENKTTPEFEVKERGKDGKFSVVKTETPVTNVRGNITGMEVKSFDFDGQTIRSVNLILQDNEEIDFVTIPTNFLGRSLLNSLLNLSLFDNVSISLYNSKPKEENGKVYAQAALRQNDEIVKWKYALTELPAPASVVFKGKKMNDYSAQDTFLLNQIAAIGEKLKNKTPAKPSGAVNKPEAANSEDVPF